MSLLISVIIQTEFTLNESIKEKKVLVDESTQLNKRIEEHRNDSSLAVNM